MLTTEDKHQIIHKLKKDLLLWQGLKPPQDSHQRSTNLGPIEQVFPNGVFPTGAIHEFICNSREDAATASGFISSLLSSLPQEHSLCLWISTSTAMFPPSIRSFGLPADRIVFVCMNREKDTLWAMEEALKCKGITAVIAELRELSFMQSRRLQLAVEKSKVTGFVLRHQPRSINNTACAARWQISHIPSELEEGLPGVGFPRWEVELVKVRNGHGGKWCVEWSAGRFMKIFPLVPSKETPFYSPQRKTS